MAILDDVLKANAAAAGKVPPIQKDFHAGRRLCVVTCIDPRLTRFFPTALGLERGDAAIVRLPGPALGTGGDLLRAVATAVFVNGCDEVLVLAHTDCGVVRSDTARVIDAMARRGVARDALPSAPHTFFALSGSSRQVALESAAAIRMAPFIPEDVVVHAAVIDTFSGVLDVLERGEGLHVVRASTHGSPDMRLGEGHSLPDPR